MPVRALCVVVCAAIAGVLLSVPVFAQEAKLADRYADVNGVRLHYVRAAMPVHGRGKYPRPPALDGARLWAAIPAAGLCCPLRGSCQASP
jgi:hypothetical protein